MTDWTIDQVKDRLELAAEVMRQAPGVKPQGYFSAWPEYFHSFADKVGQKPRMRRPLPSPRMITEADETMLWLRWLEIDDAKLLWLRAKRVPWKPICWQFGISRQHADKRWRYGLAVIVWRLRGKEPPTRRSMEYVIGKAKVARCRSTCIKRV